MSSVQGPAAGGPAPSGPHNEDARPKSQSGNEQESAAFDKALRDKGAAPDKSVPAHGQGQGKAGAQERPGDLLRQAHGHDKAGVQERPEDLLRQAHGRKQQGSNSDTEGDKASRNDGPGAAVGDAGRGQGMDPGSTRVAEAQPLSNNKAMVEQIEKIADRVMVSAAADLKMVKVDFKNSVLPGTQMMIRKDGAGKLHIELTTTSADSFNFLNKGEQVLVDTLNRKLGADVSVDIRMQQAGQDQDTGDGRSREQYQPQEDEDQDASAS